MTTTKPKCDRCKTFPRGKGLRFCSRCARAIRQAMQQSGYLEPQPPSQFDQKV